ncbi:MAG: N-acetyltransferase [Pseudomonadota bacterium]
MSGHETALAGSDAGEAGLRLLSPVPEALCDAAYDVYLDAFWPKLAVALGDRVRAAAVLRPTLCPGRAVAAVMGGRLLGVAGFHLGGAFLDPGWADLRRVYGRWSTPWRSALLSLYDRAPEPGEFLMDGIAVSAETRGRGVGSALLGAVETQARAQGAQWIRLDVVAENDGARRLYERHGFAVAGRRSNRVWSPLLGFSAAIRMRKDLRHGEPPDR